MVRLFPGTDQTAQVIFWSPRASMPAEAIPSAVRVRLREKPQGSEVEEDVLNVDPFADMVAELLPGTSRGAGADVTTSPSITGANTTIDAEIVA